jgi:hypothetical protein
MNDPDALILIPEDKTPWKAEEAKGETKDESWSYLRTDDVLKPDHKSVSPITGEVQPRLGTNCESRRIMGIQDSKDDSKNNRDDPEVRKILGLPIDEPKQEDLPHYIPLKPFEEPKQAPLSKNQKKKQKKKLNKAATAAKKEEPKEEEEEEASEEEKEEVKSKPKSKAKAKTEPKAKKGVAAGPKKKKKKQEEDEDEDDMHETEMSNAQDDLRDSLDFVRDNLSGSPTKFFKAMGNEIDYWTEERRMSNGRWVAVLRFEWQSYYVSLASIEEKLLPTAKLHTYEALHNFFRHMVQKRAFSEFGDKLSYFVIRKTPEIIDMFADDNNVGTADYVGSSESDSDSGDEDDD